MTRDLVSALALFAFVSSVTPGPNNLMLMASGANFGFRRTIPHLLGVGLGLVVMLVLFGTGLGQVFAAWPAGHVLLKAAATIYLLWLAWKIAHAAAPGAAGPAGRPMTLVQAAAFQWVNPKVWTMALTAVGVYLPDGSAASVLLVAAVFGAINLPSVASWAVLGQQMARVLTDARRRRWFNRTMAALLVAALWPVLVPA